MFDGSSIAGWKAINESDMILMPDCVHRGARPVRRQAVADPVLRHHRAEHRPVLCRDPRATAKLAEAYLKSTGIGDTILTGAEAEFFIFDSVRFGTGGNYGMPPDRKHRGPGAPR